MNLRLLLLLVFVVIGVGCGAQEELPGPSIILYHEISAGDPGVHDMTRSRGVMEMYLTRQKPTRTFSNSRDGIEEPWAVLTLVGVAEDGTVRITFGDEELRARPGQTFPGTGFRVMASCHGLGTALLRSRWTRTDVISPRPPVADAEPIDSIPAFVSVRPMPNGRVYLEADSRNDLLPMHLSIRRGDWGRAGYADPGDTIHVALMHAVGAGAHWFIYLGPGEEGRLMFYEFSSFYDIVPDTRRLIAVMPYGDPPSDP